MQFFVNKLKALMLTPAIIHCLVLADVRKSLRDFLAVIFLLNSLLNHATNHSPTVSHKQEKSQRSKTAHLFFAKRAMPTPKK